MTIHANVTAYKGKLVIELLAQKSIANEVTTSLDTPGVFGQVIENTKEHLGVSKEAIELLKQVKKGYDSIGDVDWFKVDNGNYAFGWIGGPYAIVDPMKAEGSSTYIVPNDYIEIENNVPDGAKVYLDSE